MVRGKRRFCARAEVPAICWELSKTRPRARKARRLRTAKPRLTASDTMFNSVRVRLTFWYAGVLTCTLLLLSLVIYFIVKRSVMERTDAGLADLADSFLATLDAELS